MEDYEVDVDKIMMSLNETWSCIGDSQPEESGVIRRVPRFFGPSEDFHPKFISIGLLHCGSLDTSIGQQLKWKYPMNLFGRTNDHDRQQLLETVVKHVKSIEDKVRQKYADGEQDQQVLQSHKFVEMLVLDGCFILELMLMIRNYILFVLRQLHGSLRFEEVPLQLPGSLRCLRLSPGRLRLSLVRNDLLLLENQIPFFLLLELFQVLALGPAGAANTADGTGTYFVGLAVDLVNPSKHRCPLAVQESPENIHHLLHLYHMSICPRAQLNPNGQIDFLIAPPVRFIPTATELDELGVRFKKKEKHFWSFLDVTFDAAAGVMEIPVLTIDEGTRSLFRNLIAFEQTATKFINYSDKFTHWIIRQSVNEVEKTQCGVNYCTSYVVLMSSLMDRPEDVGVLKRCGIIGNKVGSDKQVADLFNDLCATAILDKEHYLAKVFEDVMLYAGSKRQRWKARLMRDYFGNPWKTMSVIAAVILLILTMLQTFYAIYPYYNPRTN